MIWVLKRSKTWYGPARYVADTATSIVSLLFPEPQTPRAACYKRCSKSADRADDLLGYLGRGAFDRR